MRRPQTRVGLIKGETQSIIVQTHPCLHSPEPVPKTKRAPAQSQGIALGKVRIRKPMNEYPSANPEPVRATHASPSDKSGAALRKRNYQTPSFRRAGEVRFTTHHHTIFPTPRPTRTLQLSAIFPHPPGITWPLRLCANIPTLPVTFPTHHSSLKTHHSSLKTHHSSLKTHHSSLKTHHSSPPLMLNYK